MAVRPSLIVLVFLWLNNQVAPKNQSETNTDRNRMPFQKCLNTPKYDFERVVNLLHIRPSILMWMFFQGDPHAQTPQRLQTPTLKFDFFHQTDRAVSVQVEPTLHKLFHQLSNRVASSGQCSQICGLQTQQSTASKYRSTWSAYTLESNYF